MRGSTRRSGRRAAGNEQLFHYKFTDEANSGYSVWGDMFAQYGVRKAMLEHAPRAADLKGVAVYVIAAPDNLKLNPQAHFMDQESADAIVDWVKAGGVLVLMQNDIERADQVHFNLLSDRFGIHFNPVMKQDELNNSYVNTIVPVPAGTGGIFNQSFKGLMKQICTITAVGAGEVDPDGAWHGCRRRYGDGGDAPGARAGVRERGSVGLQRIHRWTEESAGRAELCGGGTVDAVDCAAGDRAGRRASGRRHEH